MNNIPTVDNFQCVAITTVVLQVAAMVSERNGFDDQSQVAARCRDTSNPPNYLPVHDDGDNGGEMVLRCKW